MASIIPEQTLASGGRIHMCVHGYKFVPFKRLCHRCTKYMHVHVHTFTDTCMCHSNV